MRVVMKTELKMKVSFYPRSKKSKSEICPIMLRVSLNGSRISLGQTGFEVASDMMKKDRVLNSYPNSDHINDELQKLEQKIYFLAEELYHKDQLDLYSLRDALNGNKPRKVLMMSELLDMEEAEMEEKFATGATTKTTYKRHKCARRNFEDFLSFKYRKKDIRVNEITKSVIHDYEDYLTSYLDYHRNTVVKYLFLLGKPIKYAYHQEWIDRNPFEGIKYTQKKTDRGFLTDDEVNLIARAKLVLSRLEIVRDSFLFSCFTGLSYVDVRNLTQDDIHEINGCKVIVIDRQKTATKCNIPLFRQAEQIIDKYEDKRCEGGRLLPMLSNQKTNQYLKEIGVKCGIKKHLTFHLARHTFATMALSKGVSIETISKVLGHTKIQTTEIYARVTPNKILEEMGILEERLSQEHYGENNARN